MKLRHVLIICVLAVALTAPGRLAQAESQATGPQTGPETEDEESLYQTRNLLAPCAGDCRITLSLGRYVETSMSSIFFDPKGPWDWEFGDIYFASTSLARTVATIGDYVSIEPEVGVGKRFGDADELEIWGALYLRWLKFPWDEYVDTTIAVSTGLNYATSLSGLEEARAGGDSSKLLHYFSPEITLALPDHPNYSLGIRLHHRSSAGIFDGGGGFQYLMGGLRRHF